VPCPLQLNLAWDAAELYNKLLNGANTQKKKENKLWIVLMAYLVANLPPVECLVRKEFLYDMEGKGQGEFTPCVWVSVKSIKGRALYIEALLTEYGALYDKIPLSAFVWKTDHGNLPLDFLEIWDSFSYNITVIEKSTLSGLRCAVYAKDRNLYHGEYMFTIDSCHSEPNELNTTLSETPNEHKSFNVIKLDNGQFAAQPNNRIRWFEQSLIGHDTKTPDFKVSTKYFSVEQNTKWSAGNSDEYFYEIEEDKRGEF